jgi:hypothetical protein
MSQFITLNHSFSLYLDTILDTIFEIIAADSHINRILILIPRPLTRLLVLIRGKRGQIFKIDKYDKMCQ